MSKFILIIFLATKYDVGSSSISHEFRSKESCEYAGKSLTTQALKRNNYVITWGCFPI